MLSTPIRLWTRSSHVITTNKCSSVDVFMEIDRFRFEAKPYASVELADEQQAQKAIKILNGNETLGNTIYLRAMNPHDPWDQYRPARAYPYHVREDEAGIKSAVSPFIEGRRVRFAAKLPAWGAENNLPVARRHAALEVLGRTYRQFGIESISKLAPQYGQSTFHPKFLCHIDFATKDGAEEAIRATHNTEIEGVLVYLKHSEIDPAKAYQIGRINKTVLKELQEKGLAPQDSEIDEEVVSKKAKKDPMKFDRARYGNAA